MIRIVLSIITTTIIVRQLTTKIECLLHWLRPLRQFASNWPFPFLRRNFLSFLRRRPRPAVTWNQYWGFKNIFPIVAATVVATTSGGRDCKLIRAGVGFWSGCFESQTKTADNVLVLENNWRSCIYTIWRDLSSLWWRVFCDRTESATKRRVCIGAPVSQRKIAGRLELQADFATIFSLADTIKQSWARVNSCIQCELSSCTQWSRLWLWLQSVVSENWLIFP